MNTLKNLKWSLALVTGLLLADPGGASAATFTYVDVDVINKAMTAGPPANSVYSGTFQFTTPDAAPNTFTATGFGPASGTYSSVFGYTLNQPIIEGTISFFFKDPKGGAETGMVTANFSNVGGITSFANYSVFSQGLEFNILTSIQSTGILNYTVTASTGNFDLIAGIGTITVNVPDGGTTLAMLGGSLLGMAAFRKRLFLGKKA